MNDIQYLTVDLSLTGKCILFLKVNLLALMI